MANFLLKVFLLISAIRLLSAFTRIMCLKHCKTMVHSMTRYGSMTKFITRSISFAVVILFSKSTLMYLIRYSVINPRSEAIVFENFRRLTINCLVLNYEGAVYFDKVIALISHWKGLSITVLCGYARPVSPEITI